MCPRTLLQRLRVGPPNCSGDGIIRDNPSGGEQRVMSHKSGSTPGREQWNTGHIGTLAELPALTMQAPCFKIPGMSDGHGKRQWSPMAHA